MAPTQGDWQVSYAPIADESPRWLEQALAIVHDQQERLRPLVEAAEALVRQRLAEEQEIANGLARIHQQLRELGRSRTLEGEGPDRQETARLRLEQQSLIARQRWLLEEVARLRRTSRRLDLALRQTDAAARSLILHPDEPESGPPGTEQRTLIAQEEERYRLARDIHDGPAQVLANALLELQYCERLLVKKPEALPTELAQLQDNLRQGLAEVRYFIFDLRPPALSDLGLEVSLRRYLQDFAERFGIATELFWEASEERLPPTHEVAVFRIIQEALQNVRKHAQAKNARVRVRRESDSYLVSVEDDGAGFNPARLANGDRKTLGMVSMRERAQLIGGTLQIASEPGGGTTIKLTVPSRQGT